MTDEDNTAVDSEFLAKCLGLGAWPSWDFPGAEPGPAYLGNWRLRYAARVITDAFRPDSIAGKIYPEIAIHNAEAWVSRAYERGVADGIRREREAWERKIGEIFFGGRLR